MEYRSNNGARALVIVLLVAVPIGAAIWFTYRITERTIQAVDRRYGDGFWLALALIVAGLVIFTLAGGALALVRRWSRHVRAKDGLFPVLDTRRGIVNPNEAGAQTLATLAGASRRVSAPTAARVIDAHYAGNNRGGQVLEPDLALPEPAPARYFPALAPVYSSPLPARLALPVGVAGDGRDVALPLRNLGNVLVAGLPGSGKSELLASMTAGLLRQDATGERVKLAVVDTKLVSFGALPDLAALWARPALEADDAAALTEGLLSEVRRRYQVLLDARARTLEEYEQRTGDRLPYLVAVYDELADMTTDPDRRRREAFTAAAMEIGRKGRAAGVSLVMATQRPSADVIPSSLRNLAGAAVAFRVSKSDDSRLVIGDAGAELLPSTPGRCLVKHAEVIEVQAYHAGLEGGRFDGFLERLPRGDVPQIVDAQQLQPLAGLAVPDWPTVATVGPVVQSGTPVAQPLEPGREPDPQLAAAMRRWYADGASKTAICNRVWGYKDGVTWSFLERVLAGDL